MLTQNDLMQIKTVVEDVVENKLKKRLQPINKELKTMNKRINKIQKNLTITINYFDNNSRDHEKRIIIIEKNIEFSQLI